MSIFRKNIEYAVTSIAAGVNTFNEMKRIAPISSSSLSIALLLLVAGMYVEKEKGRYLLTVRGHSLYSLIRDYNAIKGEPVET